MASLDWRMLQDAEDAPTLAPTGPPTTEAESIAGRDAEVLRDTMRIYGTLFTCMAVGFSYLRRKYPGVYNLRSYVEELKTHLADDQFGFFSWLWKLYFISDSEFLEECGMDAACFARVLEFGFKLSIISILNAIWLMPIYATAPSDSETIEVTDAIQRLSIAHVPSESYRLMATVIAAYSIFGFTMYNILKEFEWFILQRHIFLSKTNARNYSVYVQNIPQEYRANDRLIEFFNQANGSDVTREAQLARNIPTLKGLVQHREGLVSTLEHEINIEEINGTTPTILTLTGEWLDAIKTHYEELTELNKTITERIERIELLQEGNAADVIDDHIEASKMQDQAGSPNSASTVPSVIGGEDLDNTQGSNILVDSANFLTRSVKDVSNGIASGLPTQHLADFAGAGLKLLVGEEDGEPLTSAFVTFKTLQATQAALQMIQYPEPFKMEILEAPDPDDIFWENVGKTHKELQLGKLLSFGLTGALCLFWTIPMVTINTLSTIDGLRGKVSSIDRLLIDYPWLEPAFEQMAPLLIVVARLVLKMILERLSMFEGPVSGAVVQASLFVKLAAFMLIQTFFVSAISGGLTSELSKMIDQPSTIIETLAISLPGQSTFHTQILLVDTFLPMGLEILRAVPLAIALVRRFVGPRLTDKERNTPFMGLNPISVPDEFGHADVLSGSVLYFMVLFVYSPIAPITACFLGMCFLLMGACYRHQLIYIYPTVPDSGGRLWVKFISLLPMMMIVSEVTLMGLMSLKKAIAASTWMIPLICITVLFNLYIQQQHFRMTESLPTRIAVRKDKQLEYEEYDFSFLDSLYVQPELRDKEVMPENSTIDREIAQGGGEYGTPQNSIKSDDDDDNEAMDMDVGSGSKAADDFVTGFADVKFDDAAMKMEDVEQVEVSEDSEDLPSDNDVKYDYVKK